MAANSPNKIKDPDAKLDYGIDWSDWLADGETISSSAWTVPSGLAEATGLPEGVPVKGISGSRAFIWLQGGTAGTTYTVTNRITTSAGRIDDRSLFVAVKQR